MDPTPWTLFLLACLLVLFLHGFVSWRWAQATDIASVGAASSSRSVRLLHDQTRSDWALPLVGNALLALHVTTYVFLWLADSVPEEWPWIGVATLLPIAAYLMFLRPPFHLLALAVLIRKVDKMTVHKPLPLGAPTMSLLLGVQALFVIVFVMAALAAAVFPAVVVDDTSNWWLLIMWIPMAGISLLAHSLIRRWLEEELLPLIPAADAALADLLKRKA